MTKDFEETIKHFKPEFGNMRHIRAGVQLAKLRATEKHLADKIKTDKAIKRLTREVESLKKNILFLLK